MQCGTPAPNQGSHVSMQCVIPFSSTLDLRLESNQEDTAKVLGVPPMIGSACWPGGSNLPSCGLPKERPPGAGNVEGLQGAEGLTPPMVRSILVNPMYFANNHVSLNKGLVQQMRTGP